MTETTLPIFFSINDAYVPCLTVAIHSLINHAHSRHHYQIIILHQGLQPENQAALKALATNQVSIELLAMDEKLENQINDESNKLRGDYFTYTIYFRLFIADMFPQFDKALYLDADVVVQDDIADLFSTDLGNHLFGGVSDAFMGSDPAMGHYAEAAVGVPIHDYINSGVLLMNLAALRRERFSQHFLTLLHKYHFQSLAPDQDYLNAMGHGRILYLPANWNVQARATGISAEETHLVHYNLFRKPWRYADAAYGDYFWNAAQDLDICAQLTAVRDGYSAVQRQTDEAKLAHLEKLACDIPKQHPSFREIQAATEEVTV